MASAIENAYAADMVLVQYALYRYLYNTICWFKVERLFRLHIVEQHLLDRRLPRSTSARVVTLLLDQDK